MSQILRTKSGVCFKTAGTPPVRAANARPVSDTRSIARKLYHKTAAAALPSDMVFVGNEGVGMNLPVAAEPPPPVGP